MKKLKWVSLAILGIVVACGSIWVSEQFQLREPKLFGIGEPSLPTLRSTEKDGKTLVLPAVGMLTLKDVEHLYRQGQQHLYNSVSGPEYLKSRELLQQARTSLEQLGDEIDGTEKLYWQARIEFELGNWYQGAAWEDASKAQEALPHYATAEQLALKLVQQAPNFSDGHRLLGETQMRIISLKSWFQVLASAGAARGALERALELDPRNAEARLALGVYYLYAPQLLGGSPQRALLEFQQADSLTSDETIRFLSHRWQGVAYAKLGKIEEAREAFLKALTIYPKSAWDQNELRKLH